MIFFCFHVHGYSCERVLSPVCKMSINLVEPFQTITFWTDYCRYGGKNLKKSQPGAIIEISDRTRLTCKFYRYVSNT